VIKARLCGKPTDQYNRELHTYALPSVAQSAYIRAQLDLIGHDGNSPQEEHPNANNPGSQKDLLSRPQSQPQCMVFEWMDTDLWQLPSKPFRSGSPLPRLVARAVLEALIVFDSEGGAHADVNPNNVFVSGLDSASPIVKLGDLGVGEFATSDPTQHQTNPLLAQPWVRVLCLDVIR
jgi:serine/threonine protein kinase